MNHAGIDIANETFEVCLRRGDDIVCRGFTNKTAICDTLRRAFRGDRMIKPAHTQNF